jgi:protein involved in polysaccharide export with SLBB domain
VFGRDLFSGVPSTFAPLGAVQVNSDYLVGPGDVLQIRGWGMVDIDVNVTVNRSGEIYIPKVGLVRVSGVRYRDLQGYLKKAVGRIFTNFDLSASIAQTRSVQVYIVGQALRPGTYTFSAMSTLLNALFASGGPSATGTMRNIKLRRVGQTLKTFDLYDLLIYGDKSTDIDLQDGDVIYIPEVGPLVALLGDVKNPAIFELKKETSLAEIVSWAGGFQSAAALKNVIVEKNIDSRFQTIAEFKADGLSIEQKLAKLPLRPTDIVRVFSPGAVPLQAKAERSFVRIDGAVRNNGVYELKEGETLKGLVTRIGGVSDQAYVYATKLTRESVRANQQKNISEAADRMEKELESKAKQEISGERDEKRVAILQREYETQRRMIQSIRSSTPEGRIVLNLKSADATLTDLPDFPLEDGDMVYIPKRAATVDVIGAVFQQNTFMYDPSRSPNEYLEQAGGVSVTGDKGRIFRVCADGSVKSRKQGALSGSMNPGEALVVPEKISTNTFSLVEFLKDWTTILYQFGLGAAGLKTLKN